MSAKPDTYEVLATVDEVGATGRPPLRLLVSPDGQFMALGRAADGATGVTTEVGPYDFETIRRCAENVLAGDPRAVTWPHAQKVLAMGFVALVGTLEREMRQRGKDTAASSAEKGVPGCDPSEPTSPEVPPRAAGNPPPAVGSGEGDGAAHSSSSLNSRPSAQPSLFGGRAFPGG